MTWLADQQDSIAETLKDYLIEQGSLTCDEHNSHCEQFTLHGSPMVPYTLSYREDTTIRAFPIIDRGHPSNDLHFVAYVTVEGKVTIVYEEDFIHSGPDAQHRSFPDIRDRIVNGNKQTNSFTLN